MLSASEQLARTKASRQERRTSGIHHFGIGGSGNQAKKEIHITSSTSSSFASDPPATAASSSTPRLETEKVRYSDQPLPVGAADRLAAKLFGIRKQGKSIPKMMSTGRNAVVRENIPLRERPHTEGTQRRELVNG